MITIVTAAAARRSITRTSNAGPSGSRSASCTATCRRRTSWSATTASVKVVDFGIAKAAHRSAETQSGTLKGKVCVHVPRAVHVGAAVDRRSDVFALGIVLYELVTRAAAVQGRQRLPDDERDRAGRRSPAVDDRPDLPPRLEEIILKALAHKPDERYPTADEMRLALEHYATQAGLRTSTASLADYMKQLFGRRPEPWLVESDEADTRSPTSTSTVRRTTPRTAAALHRGWR